MTSSSETVIDDGPTLGSPVSNWKEWYELWCKATHAPVQTGLLHVGFKIHPLTNEERRDMTRLYLKVAEGYLHCWEPSDSDVRTKAFKVLVEYIFKDKTSHAFRPPSWQWVVEDLEVFDDILHFFRLAGDGNNFQNLSSRGQEQDYVSKQARSFLRSLCIGSLEIKGFAGCRHTAEYYKNLRSRREQMLEILHGLGEHKLLLRSELLSSEPILLWLKKVVEKSVIDIGYASSRLPNNFSEAVAYQSPAALIYVQLAAIRSAQKRLNRK